MSRWVVTGAAGFVGAHLVRSLLADGEDVVGLDAFDPAYDPALKEARAAWVEAAGGQVRRLDVRDRSDVDRLLADVRPDVVVHLAARAGVRPSQADPLGYLDVNVRGTGELLEACARAGGVGHVVYASSSSVYGETTPRPFSARAAADHPVSPYAATKRMNELQAHVVSHLHDLPTTGLRFFTAYGPWGRPDMAYFLFAEAMLSGREITVLGDGSARRDFTYVDDVVAAVRRVAALPPARTPGFDPGADGLAGSDAPWRVLNVGLGEPVSVADLIGGLERLLGVEARVVRAPALADEVSATHADTSDLRALVGEVPTTPLDIGLARFVDWLRAYRGIRRGG